MKWRASYEISHYDAGRGFKLRDVGDGAGARRRTATAYRNDRSEFNSACESTHRRNAAINWHSAASAVVNNRASAVKSAEHATAAWSGIIHQYEWF